MGTSLEIPIHSGTDNRPRRSLADFLRPLDALAARVNTLRRIEPGIDQPSDAISGGPVAIPGYRIDGPAGGGDPMRVGLFAAIHGDEVAGAYALRRLALLADQHPCLVEGYTLFLYPICNPTGFESNSRHSRRGADLNREFWRRSAEPEVQWLERELRERSFHGIVALHSDDTSSGTYGFARGALFTRHLLQPALAATAEILPLNSEAIIDGFAARESVIRRGYAGMLTAPPNARPRPFEVTLETPQRAPLHLQEQVLATATLTILAAYRQFIAYAADL